jgi:hypothetical protein
MARDPWLRLDAQDGMTFLLAGQPGHGRTAYLRRQPGRIVDGRMEAGHTDVFELICGQCGDHPYLNYPEVPPCLQRIRGPYTLEAGLAAYGNHLGLGTGSRRTPNAERSPARPGQELTSPGAGGWLVSHEPLSRCAESGH